MSADIKRTISESINNERMKQGLSLRQLAEKLDMKHPQIVRITKGENYNIETLIKILDGLGLEVEIKSRN